MLQEAAQSANVVRKQLQTNAGLMIELGAALRKLSPRAVVTCARGSSDHAATFAKYLIEAHTRVLTSSAAPSVSSVYDANMNVRDTVCIAISQSGKSPDLIATVEKARSAGAIVVAICNTQDSPLMRSAHYAVDICAGAETSVAATKSYVGSLSAIVHFVASWKQDAQLMRALELAPVELEQAWDADWSAAIEPMQNATNLFVVGRGFGLGIVQEAALKLKETCGLHAEGFSAAEVQHGPMALVRMGFPVLAFSQSDDTRASIESISREFARRGARVLLAGGGVDGATRLPVIEAHPVIEPMLMITSFYRMAEKLARTRGFDPDVPPHLRKVTETL